jgi:hypothetical protein
VVAGDLQFDQNEGVTAASPSGYRSLSSAVVELRHLELEHIAPEPFAVAHKRIDQAFVPYVCSLAWREWLSVCKIAAAYTNLTRRSPFMSLRSPFMVLERMESQMCSPRRDEAATISTISNVDMSGVIASFITHIVPLSTYADFIDS